MKYVLLSIRLERLLPTVNSFVWNETSALFHLLTSIQTGDHKDRCLALKRMIPNFWAMDATHYKRWSVLDLAMKSGHFPEDVIELFEREGVWRENLTCTKGGFLPIDQVE